MNKCKSAYDLLKTIITSLPGHIYWKDTNGIYLGCNQEMCRFWNISEQQLIGKTDEDIAPLLGWPKEIPSQFKKTDIAVIETKTSLLNIDETPFTDKNGRLVWQLTSKVPLLNSEGDIVGILGYSTDITARKQMELDIIHAKEQAEKAVIAIAIKESKERMRQIETARLKEESAVNKARIEAQEQFIKTANTIISSLPGSIYWKDIYGNYLGCSDEMCSFLGMSKDQIIGKTDGHIGQILNWPIAVSTKAMKDDQEVIRTQSSLLNIEEIPFTDKNGRIIRQLTSKVPLLNAEGTVIGVLGFSVDITQRKQMEEELLIAKEQAESANFAKTEFIANMSHDIRTPLTGMVGMSSLIEAKSTDPEIQEYAQDVHACGDQLLSMLNSILDVISAENINEQDIKDETFDLRHCIEDLVEIEKPTAKLKKLGLHVDFDNNIPPYIISDRTKIHRILLNLLGNAIKFTSVGSITIETKLLTLKDATANIKFAVHDTGMGIALEQQSKVFERFFRASPSYKGLYTGHGVGLHIAQSYAKLLRGEIKLSSIEGEGTTFSFELSCKIGKSDDVQSQDSLDLLPQLMTPRTNIVSPPLSSKSSSQPNLLLIEDNSIALKVLESLVIDASCQHISVTNGAEALALAKTMDFDLIISDLGLPGISGTEFTEQLRAWENAHNKRSVPIIGLTAHAETTMRTLCLQAGMDKVMTKPLNKTGLQSLIDQFYYLPLTSITTNLKKDHEPIKTLALELPDTDHDLFNLNAFPLIDSAQALSILGDNKSLLIDMYSFMIDHEIPTEKENILKAHANHDWKKIDALAHKMKGGVISLGLKKLSFACQYLERHQKTGHSKLSERLYKQMMAVLEETQQAIHQWLKTHADTA